jgi:hypothetical protein
VVANIGSVSRRGKAEESLGSRGLMTARASATVGRMSARPWHLRRSLAMVRARMKQGEA